jgi:hypothetical protein
MEVSVGHVQVALVIRRKTTREVELSVSGAGGAPGSDEYAVIRKLLDPRAAVAHEHVVIAVHRYTIRARKLTISCTRRPKGKDERSVAGKLLNAILVPIRDEDVSVAVHRKTMIVLKLTIAGLHRDSPFTGLLIIILPH